MYRGGEYSTANIPSIKCTMSSNTLHGSLYKITRLAHACHIMYTLDYCISFYCNVTMYVY